MVSVPGQKGFRVCVQEQREILKYEFRRGCRLGMDIGVDTWSLGGTIPSQRVD